MPDIVEETTIKNFIHSFRVNELTHEKIDKLFNQISDNSWMINENSILYFQDGKYCFKSEAIKIESVQELELLKFLSR